MNQKEKQLVELLTTLRTEYGATAMKASLEAEGILPYELLRTKEITMAAGIGMTIKVGGCEALTDARMSRGFGVNALMAPMIESRFALEKFLAMAESVFPAEELADMLLLINIETVDGCQKIDDILRAENIGLLSGIVLGRTDLANALKESDVDSQAVLDLARDLFTKAKEKSLRCIVGGGLSAQTVPFLKELTGLVDGFETRKVVFADFMSQERPMEEAIRLALQAERLWYLLRQDMYLALSQEDAGRIRKLEKQIG